MRIIAGIAKGMPLAVPKSGDTRPTSDRVRGAIFSSLGDRVVEASVLDLFAGTGALGLEAASRGARSVVFIEQRPVTLEQNVAAFARYRADDGSLQVEAGDVLRAMPTGEVFSLIFADPPYALDPRPVLELVRDRGLLAAEGRFVLETSSRAEWPMPAGWECTRTAVYGDTRVSYLRLTGQ